MEEKNSISLDGNDENMEEILASIREIIASGEDISRIPVPSPKPFPSNKEEGESFDAPRKSEDILVLTKKSTTLKTGESFSRREEKSPLESLVSSSLTPFIHTWLEKNLPAVVERIVKEEIGTLLTPQKSKR